MSFLVVKELNESGSALEELAKVSDSATAVTEAVNASQQAEHLGSVIAVVDEGSGACARLRAEPLPDASRDSLADAVRSKLERESSRATARVNVRGVSP